MIKQWKIAFANYLNLYACSKEKKTDVHHCAIDSLPVTRSHTTLSREVMIA